ncbi:hypothetical protein ZOD2009_10850 [Haladaptatus paucihalophilus DX253]|uniref:Small CPxCG-related zinc finger protein n=1 Tax=Haladaptatus paucihalophilus DX253 TaxID=797209 RepID=E7QTP2_HALPU|nr:hypothetical protein ZOD2009_10850 [Haladaptatus paucihalophilus DX253]SHK84351.1 hypothetical protein SAMN05444342_2370 [Haladaptatus paucihalophilus DX253]
MCSENSSDENSESVSVPDCPVCGAPVLLVVTRGPDTHECRPCGCSVGLETARDFFER